MGVWRTMMSRRRHTAVTAGTVVALILGSTYATSCARDPLAQDRDPIITVGHARFEVLSPTLIRTEYTGEGTYFDDTSFNVPIRRHRPQRFSSQITDGWLTVRTTAMTLRYRVDSGPFTTSNLIVQLTGPGASTTFSPWRHLICTSGALCEAETAHINGVQPAVDHPGYTGTGFLAGFVGVGDFASFDINVATPGPHALGIRYANGGHDGATPINRTLTISVDGGQGKPIAFPPTDSWDAWATTTATLDLGVGPHTVSLTHDESDSGHVNIDSVALLSGSADYPGPPSTAVVNCRFGVACEAEDQTTQGTASVASDHSGFGGTGFVANLDQGTALTAQIGDVPADGTYSLHLRYSNGTAADDLHQARSATVLAGTQAQQVTFPPTTSWDDWQTTTVPVTLKAGTDAVRIGCPDPISCHVNLDQLAVTGTDADAPPPHIALGGYRRGFDGVNGDDGNPPTTAGLLHTDGWYLLDDTNTARYEQNSLTVAPRTVTRRSYQDGYVFGYGRNYKQGLTDLADLTGSPVLLPRWAYGVWFSEYISRTATDFQDTIVPRFRDEGVPLDVLVLDTDFKSPNPWNGWEFDPAKFPDPGSFIDWAAAAGIQLVLNIHPSISESDPQLDAAQASAGQQLPAGDCAPGATAGCRVFDWGNASQMTAYVKLHDGLRGEHNNISWWLDWCCDTSSVNLPGVTPDAYINAHYAALSANSSGRGFVLSRAYGSLQSGGNPGNSGLAAGPWADKRTTIHFTGDTASSWGTLAREVSWTPAESAATGLSAISHDIGGHNDTTDIAGAETYPSDEQTHRSTKLADDLYARWVQLGTFQPIDRLHGNHSDRLPWQYGPRAAESAKKFLRLREALVPYTYGLAHDAHVTGVPVVRPTYLEYPDDDQAYRHADSEYFYGPDLLVAPVTTPGEGPQTRPVWLPAGDWVDLFTGTPYSGGIHDVTSNLDSMPVFLRQGGIIATYTGDVASTSAADPAVMTLLIAEGRAGRYTLYDDTGTTGEGTTTTIGYDGPVDHTVTIGAATGSSGGQPAQRIWTITYLNAQEPAEITVNGAPAQFATHHWDPVTRRLTITLPRRSVQEVTTIGYR